MAELEASPQQSEGNWHAKAYRGRKRGPKTKWGKIDPIKVAVLAGKLGATESQLAAALGVTTQSLRNWKKERKQLFCALNEAKAQADKEVEHSLFHRAKGYSHNAVKITSENGKVKKVPYIEHYPPDTTACIFWLKNRNPIEWRERSAHVIENPDGSAVSSTTTVIAPTVVFVQPAKEQDQLGNGNDTTDI